MNQWREDMKARTHSFAVDVVAFVDTMADNSKTRRFKDQLVGAAWGVDGNWRAACCARTHKEFTAKLGTVVEEADEAEELLNLIHDSKLSTAAALPRLRDESTQLRKIFRSASITASQNERRAEERRRLERANRTRRRRKRDL
jgi:four helix bundle protein